MDTLIDNIVVGDANATQQDAQTLSLETALELSQALAKRLETSEHNIRDILLSHYSAYTKTVEETARAQHNIDELLQGVDELQSLLGDDQTGIGARQQQAIEQEDQLREQLKESQAVLECLNQLSDINAELMSMDRMVREGKLDGAAQAAMDIRQRLQEAYVIKGSRIHEVLEGRISTAVDHIRDRAESELRKGLDIRVDRGTVAQMEAQGNFKPLLSTLETLGVKRQAMSMLSNHIVQSFVRPVLSEPHLSLLASNNDPTKLAVVLDSEEDACGVVAATVEFVNSVLGVAVWKDQQGLTDISQMALERCFLPNIPMKRQLLDDFRATTVSKLVDFEKKMFELGETKMSTGEDGCPISQASSKLDELFMDRLSSRALEQIRTLAKDTSFDVYDVEQGHSEFPRCTISLSAHKMIQTVYQLVNESQTTTSPGRLLDTVLHGFGLYRAIYLTLNRPQLTKIPALAWQFFNDCMYISHHADIVGKRANDSRFLEVVSQYVGAANALVDGVVEREITELERMVVSSSDGFFNAAAEESRLAKLRKQLELSVAQLARTMKPPAVTPHVYYQRLGRYVDAVLRANVDAITDVRDIGVDDSQALSDHLRAIYSLSELFSLDAQVLDMYKELMADSADNDMAEDMLLLGDDSEDSSVSLLVQGYCRHADKLVQLADILVISRADIMSRYRAGLLGQFSVEELVGLVKALFSDTPERSRDITVILANTK